MLWSLLKILLFMGIVAALSLGVGFLTDLQGVALITVAGREFVFTPMSATILALIVLFVAWLLFRLAGLMVAGLRFINGDETAITRYFNRRAERKGYESLASGMMALAAGEGRLAIRKAERAETYLHRPELTKLVVAQGAEMVGDQALATKTYKALVLDEQTRFVGIRGLMKQKLLENDTDTALKLAEKALILRPQNEEVQTTLLRLQTTHENWAGARATLAVALKSGTLPREVHRRRDAILALAHAQDTLADGHVAEAVKSAREANRLAPNLPPAAAMAARLVAEDGNQNAAAKILRTAWADTPHPDIAAAFAEIVPDETAAERLHRFKPLLAKHPQHPETRLLEAELRIAAEDFPAARRALGDLAETAPTVRSLTIMAAIERGEGAEDRVVRAWLAQAVTAARGPQWVCGVCGHIHADWRPVCLQCESFDLLSWQDVGQSADALTGAARMLPLIVGALEHQSGDAVKDVEEADVDTPPRTETTAPIAETTADAEPVDEPTETQTTVRSG